MTNKQKALQSLYNQTNEAIQNSMGGYFAEYPLPCDDYLTVIISLVEARQGVKAGIHVHADFDKPTYFSGEVIEDKEGFKVPFDPEYFTDIHHYLEAIADEIDEGYLSPNDLLCE